MSRNDDDKPTHLKSLQSTKCDPNQSKVAHIFQKHGLGEVFHRQQLIEGEIITSPDGFSYVSFRKSGPQRQQMEADLEQLSYKYHYLIQMVEHLKDHLRVDNYHVPGDRLNDFLADLAKRPGRIVEIRQLVPDILG